MWTSIRTAADALDDADVLAGLRLRYDLPPGLIRLDGYSGGPLPRTSPARLRRFVQHRWEPHGGRSQRESEWRSEAQRAAAALAPLLGADPVEITIAESTSINLFKALVAAARTRADRPVLVVGRDCFATDRCLARSAAEHIGGRLVLIDDPAELTGLAMEQVAVVALSHTDLHTGGVRDAKAITAEIQRHGALALWDLSHSAGALDVDLHDWDADFAIGCGYKYLGGSATAPSYSFVADRFLDDSAGVRHPLAECFGGPAAALAAVELRAVLSILDGVPTGALARKARGLTELFLQRTSEFCDEVSVNFTEPAPSAARGAQVVLRHPDSQRLADALSDRGVLAECADTDLLRFHFPPTWLSHLDVCHAAEQLHAALHEIG